jgi:hypothetical protein
MSGKYKWSSIFYDNAAGQAEVRPCGKGKVRAAGGIAHRIPRPIQGDSVGTYPEHEVREVLNKLAGPSSWAVFWNNGAGDGYVEEVDGLSGNYRGSGHWPHTCVGEYDTREEANAALAALIAA